MTEVKESAKGTMEQVPKLSLFGFLPAQALLSQFDAGLIASPKSKEDLLKAWEASHEGISRLGPSGRSFVTPADIRDIDSNEGNPVKTLSLRLKTYSPFDSHQTAISLVRVNKLVTPQLMVNLHRLQRRALIAKDSTLENLLEISFEPGKNPEPVIRQTIGMGPNGGALMFTSYDEDIRLHQPPLFRNLNLSEKDDRSATLESICFPVGGGLPFAYAFKVEIHPGIFRLVLANGIHRVASAAMAGLEFMPMALCDLTPMELPDQFVDAPKAMLLDPNFNAPIISDFANEQVAIKLSHYRQLRTVRFNWNFEQYAVGLR